MKTQHLLLLACAVTVLGAYAAELTPNPPVVALRFVAAADAFSAVQQKLGAKAADAVSQVDEKRNTVTLDSAHPQVAVVRAFLIGLDRPPEGVRLPSSAEEIGTTGMWINERKNPDEPLRTGLVWTNSPAEKVGIKPGLFLIAVNGTNVVSKPTTQVMSMVRGPVGAVVTLELADAALTKTNKFTVKRGRAVIRNNQIIEIAE
jgi:hypothetical protein